MGDCRPFGDRFTDGTVRTLPPRIPEGKGLSEVIAMAFS
jgi:hypothetical protein